MIVVGTSGWQYDDWRAVLYEGVPKKSWLEHFATRFSACEINNTFYRLPNEVSFASWRTRTPDEFVFSVKASRFITHVRRLVDVEEAVTTLIERASALGPKLGAVLYQTPPSLHRNDETLKRFLEMLPSYPRATIEFRHDSWLHEDVSSMLREHNVARCITSSSHIEATASFAYLRLHGGPEYSRYEPEELTAWTNDIAHLSANGVDPIFVFFDNDVEGNAVLDATELRDQCEGLGLETLRPSGTLFDGGDDNV
ncbi:MAG: DUF72 domain-containing protein [Actinomycetota bacterium]